MIIAFDLSYLVANKNIDAEGSSVIDPNSWSIREDVARTINHLSSKGHVVVIYTRLDPSMMLDVERWLQKNKVSYHHVVYGLPKHHVYFGWHASEFHTEHKALDLIRYLGGVV